MFGRATITLGIGPHSSFSLCYSIFVSLMHAYFCSVGLRPRFIVYFVVISAGF